MDAAAAVRRTPNPGRDDHAEIVIPGGQPGAEATKPGSLVSQDAGNGTGDLRADLVERVFKILEPRLLEHLEVEKGDLPGWAAVQHTARWDAEAVADALLAAGWTPPASDPTLAAAQQREERAVAEARPHDDEPQPCPAGECNQGMCGSTSDHNGPCGGCCGCLGGCLDYRAAEQRADRHAEIVEAERSEEVHGG